MASRWCFSEITHAKALGKSVFPIKIDNAQVDRILTSAQVIDATAGWDQAYQRLEKGFLAAGLDPKKFCSTGIPGAALSRLAGLSGAGCCNLFRTGQRISVKDKPCSTACNSSVGLGSPLMLGASGSGKSSLMRAGLLPRLKRDLRWQVIDPFRPLNAPFEELALVLSKRFTQVAEAEKKNTNGRRGFWSRSNGMNTRRRSLSIGSWS